MSVGAAEEKVQRAREMAAAFSPAEAEQVWAQVLTAQLPQRGLAQRVYLTLVEFPHVSEPMLAQFVQKVMSVWYASPDDKQPEELMRFVLTHSSASEATAAALLNVNATPPARRVVNEAGWFAAAPSNGPSYPFCQVTSTLTCCSRICSSG